MRQSTDLSTISDQKKKLVEYLLQTYNRTSTILEINNFNENYSSDDALQRYNVDEFIYRKLNEALCHRNLELICIFQFFIVDLYEQMMKKYKIEHYEQSSNSNSSIIYSVYRRQYISVDQIQQIQNSVNSLMSVNCFFSTTTVEKVADKYPWIQIDKAAACDLECVLFKINIDPNLDICQYANIENNSYDNDEKEILFIPGTIFKIKNISYQNQYLIELQLVSKNDKEFDDIFSYWKEHSHLELNPSLLYSYWFIVETDKLYHAEQFYQFLLKYLPENDPFIIFCYFGLGNISEMKKDYAKATIYYTHSKDMSHDEEWCAKCDTALANICLLIDDEVTALNYYKKALTVYQSRIPLPYRNIAECYSNIGRIQHKLKNNTEAVLSFKEALKYSETNVETDSLDLIAPLRALAKIYQFNGEYIFACLHQERALQIGQRYLRSTDPLLGCIYEEIGRIYEATEKIIQALSCYHRAAEIYYYSYPKTDSHNINIGECIICNNKKLR